MNETQLTIVGNLVETPVLRVTQTGTTVTNIRLASTSRRFDKDSGRWGDGETFFMSVTCWRQLAEHVCESLEKGDRVVTVGRVRQRTYTTDDGVKRVTLELEADAVGPELARCPATLRRVLRRQAQDVDGAPLEPAGDGGSPFEVPLGVGGVAAGSPLDTEAVGVQSASA